MNFMDDLKRQLKHKERKVEDLIRFIETRNEINPNYSLLLGAGASVSSGVKTASELIDIWRKETYLSLSGKSEEEYKVDEAKSWLSSNETSWYNSTKEYSSLFEKKYDLPRQRRMFVEQEVENSFPSLGYAYLIRLTEENYFNTIFTTNYDDLINEAFYQFTDIRPIVCAHDSSVQSITITSKRPKIIKLHGDYLFDDIKSTLRETESLEDNIRNKFIEFTKEFGLIVLGYAGNDRSVMDVLFFLLKSEIYLKSGIYWCIRKGDLIGDELRKLLWKDRVFYVEIEGFDEVMAHIYQKIIGNNLPVDNTLFSKRMIDVVDRYISSDSLKESKNDIIQKHLEQLKNDRNTSMIADFIQSITKFDRDEIGSPEISDEEFITLLRIEKLFKLKEYDEVLVVIAEAMKGLQNVDFKKLLLRRKAKANRLKNDRPESIKVYDELIEIAPENPNYNIEKAKLYYNDMEATIAELDRAIEKDTYFYFGHYLKAIFLKKIYRYQTGDKKKELFEEIYRHLMTSISRFPLIKNPAWESLFLLVLKNGSQDDSYLKPIEIINKLSEQDKYSPVVTGLILMFCEKQEIKEYDNKKLIDIVKNAKEKRATKDEVDHTIVLMDTLKYLKEKEMLKSLLVDTKDKKKFIENVDFVKKQADLYYDVFYNIDMAIRSIKKIDDLTNHGELVTTLFGYYLSQGNISNSEELLMQYDVILEEPEKAKCMADIFEARDQIDSAIDCIVKLKSDPYYKEKYTSLLSYYFLKKGDNNNAKKVAEEFLKEVNFSIDYKSEIINYELARHRLKKKIHKERVANILSSAIEEGDRAYEIACYLLLEDNRSAIAAVKKWVEFGFSNIDNLIKWPLCNSIKDQLIERKKKMELSRWPAK